MSKTKVALVGCGRIGSTHLQALKTIEEVEIAVRVMRKQGNKDLTVLHCTSEYPAPYSEVNLKAMVTLKEKLKTKVDATIHVLLGWTDG